MSEPTDSNPEDPHVEVPRAIQAVIDEFGERSDPYTCMEVSSALGLARQSLDPSSTAENCGAWAEVLAFGLASTEHNEKPWGTYFGPMGSGVGENSEIFYFPDATQADPTILAHWRKRARCVKAPVLSARYNDLVWDLSGLIAKEQRNVEFARRAIDAYLAAARQEGRDAYFSFPEADRALALAIQINDTASRDLAREMLLTLHQQAIIDNGMWWKAYDILESQPKSGLTNAEREGLIADLEGILARVSDTSDPAKFDPHDVENVAKKLIVHYRRIGNDVEVQRLHLATARAFEHFASLADPMLASMVLQTSMDAYRQAKMKTDEERILGLIEKRNVESTARMTRHEVVHEVPAEAVEEFIAQVIGTTHQDTFRNIAGQFLTIRSKIEETLEHVAQSSPLSTIIPQTKLSGDRVVARIGSLDEDLIGHLINQTNLDMSFSTPWLGWAIGRAKERHRFSTEDIVSWVNRTGLFGDGALLHEGLAAWLIEDHVKAAHILIPQVEAGFRKFLGHCGRPTTKAHPQMRQARMVITLGEVLSHDETAIALGKLGPDITLHFRSLYADPRGKNLRNDLAHGLIAIEDLNASNMLWVVHSLLLLGALLEPKSGSDQHSAPDGSAI